MKLIYIIPALILLWGCSKYSDGPAISFLSRKSRIVNHWELETATANGEAWTPYFTLKEMILNDDNTQVTTFRTLNVPTVLDGQWEFTNRKENLHLIFSNGLEQTFRIDKLKEDELGLTIFSKDTTFKLNYITFK